MSSPHTSLCLEQESLEFSQSLNLGKSLEFFRVPEPIWTRQLEERHLTNRLYFKEEEAWNFFKSQGLYKKGEIGIFVCPSA